MNMTMKVHFDFLHFKFLSNECKVIRGQTELECHRPTPQS